jgi:hypothetical protein
MTAHERHGRLSRDFVLRVVAEVKTESEMMVVIETAILATMLALRTQYGLQPAHCSAMIESAIHAATERFAELEKAR